MKVIKRDGRTIDFDRQKIEIAIEKANKEVPESARITELDIVAIAGSVTEECEKMGRSMHVEEVQDMVENRLMDMKAFVLARKYITYRYTRDLFIVTLNKTEDLLICCI